MQVALAWLLQRSPNILLIPGTSSVAHLESNLAAAHLELSASDLGRLDALHPGGARGTDDDEDVDLSEDADGDTDGDRA